MAAATTAAILPPLLSSRSLANQKTTTNGRITLAISNLTLFSPPFPSSFTPITRSVLNQRGGFAAATVACLPSPSPPPLSSSSSTPPSTRLYVSGLSFRTSEEGLRKAFEVFGQLMEVNLVMDRIANRPRGFAFLRYARVEESQRAIEGMHGKFLDGRVIFVEVAKPRSQLQQSSKQTPRPY